MKSTHRNLNWKQKILLEVFNNLDTKEYSRLKVFKIAFLLSREIDFYDFVPYKYGPYSFEMDKDLRMFSNNGWIRVQNNSISIDKNAIGQFSYETGVTEETYTITNKFKNLNEKSLLEFVYNKFPYYSQNSLLVEKPTIETAPAAESIYTIGYQNLSIDMFINVLIEKGIQTLLDVRNKPLSYKYGFNNYWLKKYLPEFGIQYISIPELGIEEKYRKTLPMEQLWEHYLESLKEKMEYLERASNIITQRSTVLMCYEMKPEDCHRSRLASKLQELINLPIINYDVRGNQWIPLRY